VFREMRRGELDEAALEAKLDSRGFMNRFLGGLTLSITKPWQIYPVGLLFGLGFDTATEVGLLVIAGGAAAFQLPWYAILTLPVLFAAGMSLLDSIDGCFMNFAYDWAFSRPIHKVYYNIAVTALSVAVALVVGTVELLGLLADNLSISSGPLAWVAGLDLNHVGYAIAGLFVLTWAVALAVWRLGRIEERWSPESSGAQSVRALAAPGSSAGDQTGTSSTAPTA
jgi:high-affinity nickel-transport protein